MVGEGLDGVFSFGKATGEEMDEWDWRGAFMSKEGEKEGDICFILYNI